MTNSSCQMTNIESELSKIWESLEGSQKTWASLFNIVFYAKSAPGKENYRWLAELVSKKFPCRSIFISENPDPNECYFRVNVAAETIGEGELSVVCDQIFIEVAGKEREKIPFLILPHFLPDLPIYVIWTDDPSQDDPLLDILRKHAQKFIYDPGDSLNLQSFSSTLMKQLQAVKHCAITDIPWILTSGWREVIASTIHTPKRVDELFRSRYIRIGYNQTEVQSISDQNQALYLQAWIASQFNWKVNDLERIEGNVRVCYSRFMYDTVVLLTPESYPGLLPGTVTSIEIESMDNGAHFYFQRSKEEKKVKILISSADRCDIPYQIYFTQANLKHMLLSELFRKGTSDHYRNVLALLYELY